MSVYPLVISFSHGWIQAGSTIRYYPVIGDLDFNAAEAPAQKLARDSYTLANLYVRVVQNDAGANVVYTSRVSGAPGNMSVTVAAGLTGVFRDTVNSDNLVSGNLFNTKVDNTSLNDIYTSIIAYTLTPTATDTFILGSAYVPGQLAFPGWTRYICVGGYSGYAAAEATVQYIFRTPATLSRFRIYVTVNTLDVVTTYRTRKNGANGNQSVSIGAGTTGSFEDAANTDNVVAGNTFNYQLVIGAGAGQLSISLTQLKSSSAGQQKIESHHVGRSITASTTYWWAIEGTLFSATTIETRAQLAAQAALTGKNMFARVISNTLNVAFTLRTRINGGNGNLIVSVGAGATGAFEDTVNTDTYVAADLINFQTATGVGAGQAKLTILGIELEQPGAPPTGIQDKSAHMGSKLVAAGVI